MLEEDELSHRVIDFAGCPSPALGVLESKLEALDELVSDEDSTPKVIYRRDEITNTKTTKNKQTNSKK